MSGGTLNLSVTLVTSDPKAYCFTGETKIQTIRIRNTGAAPASEVNLFASIQIPGSYTGNMHIDTLGGWIVRDSTGLIIDTTHAFSGFVTFAPGNSFESPAVGACSPSTHKMVTAIASLADIMITPGGYVDVDVITKTRDFSCEGCAGTATHILQFNLYSLRGQTSYKNQCGTSSYNSAYVTFLQSYPVGELSMNIEMTTDIWAGDTFNFCYNGNLYANHLEEGGI